MHQAGYHSVGQEEQQHWQDTEVGIPVVAPVDVVPIYGLLVLGQQRVTGGYVEGVGCLGQTRSLAQIQPGASMQQGLGYVVVLVEVVYVGVRLVIGHGSEGGQIVLDVPAGPGCQRSQNHGQGQMLTR